MKTLHLILILIALAVIAGAILYNSTNEVVEIPTPTPKEIMPKHSVPLEEILAGGAAERRDSVY